MTSNPITEEQISIITKEVKQYLYGQRNQVPVGVSNRHLHLAQEDLVKLFGADYELTPKKFLMGKVYAAQETVKLIGPKGVFEEVRILGPARSRTQVEISLTDSYQLGIKAPIRNSGDLDNTPGVVIVGPAGVVDLKEGVICAKRHIHIPPNIAQIMELNDGEYVDVKIEGPRSLVYSEVLVRVRKDFNLEMHIDIDEANAAGLANGELVKVIK